MENYLPLQTSESQFISVDKDEEKKVNFSTLESKI